VELVPFPFRFGVAGRERQAANDFDHAGQWVLEVGPNGMLHAWRTDGSTREVLPRPTFEGVVLTTVEAIRGVFGGFAVCGRIRDKLVAAHYDFDRRHCRVHVFRSTTDAWDWFYFPDYHAIVARGEAVSLGLDLRTGERGCSVPGEPPLSGSPADRACVTAARLRVSPPEVAIEEHFLPPVQGPRLTPDRSTGSLLLRDEHNDWKQFTPLAEGRPCFREADVLRAVLRGSLLGVLARHGKQWTHTLRLLRLPTGAPVAEFAQPKELNSFTLSTDARLLLRRIDRGRFEVRDLTRGLVVAARTPCGGFHPRVQVALGEMWLTIQCGTRTHLIRWDRPALEVHSWEGDRDTTLRQHLHATPEGTRATFASAGGLPAFAGYDRRRFVAAAHGPLIAVVDGFGQVALFEGDGTLVCMFFAFRRHVAAWLPDGTRHGPTALTGAPPTPGAAAHIARALRTAWQRGKESRP
jgi:hypothetical protein